MSFQTFRTALLLLASAGVSAVGAEGALRMLEGDPPPEILDAELLALPELRTVLDLARPDVHGRFKGRPYRTHAHGFRGREPAIEKPRGTFRIAVIGDSVTMGQGVADEETYSARLEAWLDPTGEGRFEVLNLGISGLNLRQSLDHRLPIALRFAPDLIVYGFTINDLEDLPGYWMTRRQAWPETRWALVRHSQTAWSSLAEELALPGSYRGELEENFFRNPRTWFEFEADLDRLARIARNQEACVVVLLHAHLADRGRFLGPMYDRVEGAAQQRGLHVVSSLPRFEGIPARSLWVRPDDPHPNAEGHRRLAEALAEGLVELPEPCWKGVTLPRRSPMASRSPVHAAAASRPGGAAVCRLAAVRQLRIAREGSEA